VSPRPATVADAERLFGVADDSHPTSLLYRFARTRTRDGQESTENGELRFPNGVLSKICRTRS